MSKNYIILCLRISSVFIYDIMQENLFIISQSIYLTLTLIPGHLKAQLYDSTSHTLILDITHTETLMKT
jgi:hypothetical protein